MVTRPVRSRAGAIGLLTDTIARLSHTRVLGFVRQDEIFQHLQDALQLRAVRARGVWQ